MTCSVAPSTPASLLVALVLLTGCVTERSWKPGPKRVTTTVYDDKGSEVVGTGSPYKILGLSPNKTDPLAEAATQDTQGLTPQEIQRRREAAIRNQFGSTVVINGDLVTKRYFLSTEPGEVFKKISGVAAGSPVVLGGKGDTKSILGSMLAANEVSISYIDKFESVPALLAGPVPGPKMMIPTAGVGGHNDLLLVTAKAPDLAAFEDAINLFYSNIPQVEITVKVVEFSTSESLSFGTGVANPSAGETPASLFTNLASGRLVGDITSSFPLNPPVGSGLRSKGMFSLGGIHDGWELDATLEALQAQGKADVLSSPKLMVRNGGTAAIATFTEMPFPQAKVTVTNIASTNISFKPVGITLGIKPVIAGTETIILQIHADVSAVTGFAATDPIDTPIISTRTAMTSVHVPNGKSTIIGGLRTTTSLSNETKIPILGDIPILGYLFRSTTTQASETQLSFIITPRIRIGSQDVLAR
ncbi:MAG: hypothetical protein VX951_10570 [Planctomycetota bacterium]|nr:hypothetical protein [Planctomycetota bacterium]